MKKIKLSIFLKENKCYDKFVKNFSKESEEDWKDNAKYSISGAFNWKASSEGFEYWNNISNKWIVLDNRENDMLWLLK